MKKWVCVLICLWVMTVTSAATEAVETDYVNIKQAVIQLVADRQYEQAVACIDAYGYTVQSKEAYYQDLQNDRAAISEVIYGEAFAETCNMITQLQNTGKFGLCILYIDEQLPRYADCPNFTAQLQSVRAEAEQAFYQAEYAAVLQTAQALESRGDIAGALQTVQEALVRFDNQDGAAYAEKLRADAAGYRAKSEQAFITGTFTGDGVTLKAFTDETGTVISYLTVEKNGTVLVLADDTNRGYIYTEPNGELRACGAFTDSALNTGYVYAYKASDTVHLEIAAHDFASVTPAGSYVLEKQ